MDIDNFIDDYAENNYDFEGDTESYFIAKLIYHHARGEKVLDLGCGPVHHLLALFIKDYKMSFLLDLHQENLDYINKCKNHNYISKVHCAAFEYRRRYLRDSSDYSLSDAIKCIYSKISRYQQGNVLTKYEHLKNKFDCIMQIGCFGALDSYEQFNTAIINANHYLKKGGVLIMANWIQTSFGDRPFSFNGKVSSYLNKANYNYGIRSTGMRIIKYGEFKKISDLSKKQGYSSILYAVAKKPQL